MIENKFLHLLTWFCFQLWLLQERLDHLSLKKHWLLNLEPAYVQTGQIFDKILVGDKLVNISRANFKYVLLTYPILKFVFKKTK